MIFTELPLDGAFLIDIDKKNDERGFFARYFCTHEFTNHGLENNWVQMNISMTRKKGTVRGMHYQRPPRSEVKVVRCLHGAIWDAIVDLRKGSKTFGKWFGIELSESNRTMMYVPKGFAHGFVSLTDNTEILYLVSEFYSPEHESGLRWNDPDVRIEWSLNPNTISTKDTENLFLCNTDPMEI